MEVLSLPATAADLMSAGTAHCRASYGSGAGPSLPAAAVDAAGPGSDSCSLASGSSDADAPQADALDPIHRTHHLLKHCLSHSQRGAALAQFHTDDPREAAKEIARMGQRELQAKFKEVYGSATKSNNNSWLRRKLYEAVGVAPLKATTKGKTRKGGGHASASRKSKDGHGAKAARSPKLVSIKVKREAGSPQHVGSAGPLSILDLQAHSGLASNDTSDSEEGEHSASFPAKHHSAPSTPRSPLGHPFPGSPLAGPQDGQPALVVQPRRPSPLAPSPPTFMPLSEPQSPLAPGLHWADGLGSSAPLQQSAPPADAAVPDLFVPGGQGLGPLGAELVPGFSPFKPMELEQDALWEADAEAQPWYFGSNSIDLNALALPRPPPPIDCGGAPVSVDDDDDIPLLTLDLGAIDVSI